MKCFSKFYANININDTFFDFAKRHPYTFETTIDIPNHGTRRVAFMLNTVLTGEQHYIVNVLDEDNRMRIDVSGPYVGFAPESKENTNA